MMKVFVKVLCAFLRDCLHNTYVTEESTRSPRARNRGQAVDADPRLTAHFWLDTVQL